MTKIQREELIAIRRLFRLIDGYISTQDQDMLLGWDGGLMIWPEIRQNNKIALKTSILKIK